MVQEHVDKSRLGGQTCGDAVASDRGPEDIPSKAV